MKPFYRILVFILLFTAVVVPNSLKVVTAGLLSVGFVFFISPLLNSSRVLIYLKLYFIGAFVSIFYVVIGALRGAPQVAVLQVVLIYVATPLMWMAVSVGVYRYIGVERLVSWFVWFALCAAFSVAIYFFLFVNFGPAAVGFFIDEDSANLDLESGYAGATMQVYGSLIFLCGAFFGVPNVIKSNIARLFLLVSLLVVALTSGRAALFLAIPVGISTGLFLSLINGKKTRDIAGRKRVFVSIFSLIVGAVLCGFLLYSYTDIDLSLVVEKFVSHISSGGGVERSEQAEAIFFGIVDSYGLGGGHGIGVKYLRSELYPWRYELVWLVSVLRVGLLGATIYALPFLFYIVHVVRLALAGRLALEQRFMFCGFFSAFLASGTNPYIESIVFQWMFVLPMVLGVMSAPRRAAIKN